MNSDKLIPDYILELIRQSIDMVEGDVYPKDMIELVPGMLRKVVKQLERRNEENSIVKNISENDVYIIERYWKFISFFQDNSKMLNIPLGADIPNWIVKYFTQKVTNENR